MWWKLLIPGQLQQLEVHVVRHILVFCTAQLISDALYKHESLVASYLVVSNPATCSGLVLFTADEGVD